jgi:hypothetical protein
MKDILKIKKGDRCHYPVLAAVLGFDTGNGCVRTQLNTLLSKERNYPSAGSGHRSTSELPAVKTVR